MSRVADFATRAKKTAQASINAVRLLFLNNSRNFARNKFEMKTRSDFFLVAANLSWEYAGEGVTRQILGYDGQLMLVKVKFEKGAVGTQHVHYHTQSTYVASGKFEVTIEGKKRVLETGDGFYVEPDALHGCVCLEAGILIDTFSPMRADFLK
jgi:quercetin dioxygenase-like cupin family protein